MIVILSAAWTGAGALPQEVKSASITCSCRTGAAQTQTNKSQRFISFSPIRDELSLACMFINNMHAKMGFISLWAGKIVSETLLVMKSFYMLNTKWCLEGIYEKSKSFNDAEYK